MTKQEIDEAREAYRTVATRGSIIYFVIADMARIGVPRCRGAFTPSTRVVMKRWFGPVEAPRCSAHDVVAAMASTRRLDAVAASS